MRTRSELKRDIENAKFDRDFYRGKFEELRWEHFKEKSNFVIEIDKLKAENTQLKAALESITICNETLKNIFTS